MYKTLKPFCSTGLLKVSPFLHKELNTVFSLVVLYYVVIILKLIGTHFLNDHEIVPNCSSRIFFAFCCKWGRDSSSFLTLRPITILYVDDIYEK